MTGEGVEADEDEEQVEQGDHLHLWEPDGESGGLAKSWRQYTCNKG